MRRAFALGLCLIAGPSVSQEVQITPDAAFRSFWINGENIVIERNQDTSHRLDSEFTKTSRPCPPFCILPMSAGAGVATVGELEVMAFLEAKAARGAGLLVDSRLPEWFVKGTIPGAVNVPFATLDADNPYRDQILQALGARQVGSRWDFSNALELLMFCNGPWSDQSPRAVRSLLDAGYPPEKILYYRGGIQVWLQLGLTVKLPTA
ncbi:rhodanese-like domain-containing protein [Maliponia aquimaris]|nr:rhodanese-like domain-containing protein [Maliponia aquimaris]